MSDEPTKKDRGAIPTVVMSGSRTPPATIDTTGDLVRGDCVGRYIIVEPLGHGGMGVVFTAYDPELNRRIALKLLRLKPEYEDVRDEFRARLMREAQALAQLSHPNVIAVHDVGTYRGDVFIAMELVDGRTLRAVLRDDKPTQAQVMELFLAAGRGLAAAHAAGMVHRDFKPDNVMVGNDGRVRVLDFGLARAVRTEADPPLAAITSVPAAAGQDAARASDDTGISHGDLHDSRESSTGRSSTSSLLGVPLTQFGAVMGTRSYMPPEQLAGENVDARADQFSFCVALFIALYNAKPFPKSDGPPTGRPQVPSGARVPVRVRDAVLRGLELAPDARFPTMDDLLAALSEPVVRRWPWLVGGGVAAVASAAVILAASQPGSEPSQLCRGADQQLVGIWDGARRDHITSAFSAVDRVHGADTAQRVATTFDAYAAKWVVMRTESCEATRVRGDQTEHDMELRTRCLNRVLSRLQALVDQLADHADRAALDLAANAAGSLPQIHDCANLDVLSAAVPPPKDPAIAAKVAAVRQTIDYVDALRTTGHYRAAFEPAHAASAAAAATAYPPVEAESLLAETLVRRLASDDDTAEALGRQALARAGEAQDIPLLARMHVDYLITVSKRPRNYGDAAVQMLIDTAIAAVNAAGNPDELHARLLAAVGLVHWQTNALEKAADDLMLAQAEWEKVGGANHPERLKVLNNLASVQDTLGRYSAAVTTGQNVVDAETAVLGPDHPDVGIALRNLGLFQVDAGDYVAARKNLENAIATSARATGPDSREVAVGEETLGDTLSHLGQASDALAHLQKSLALREKLFGANDPSTARTYGLLAETFGALGRVDDAQAAYNRALAIRESVQPADDAGVIGTLLDIARFDLANHRVDEAWTTADRARAIADDRVQTSAASTYAVLAEIRSEQHRVTDAVHLLEHAVELDLAPPIDVVPAGDRLAALADAYIGAGDSARAKSTYERALKFSADQHEASPARLSRLWLGVGISELNLGHVDAATVALDRAIDLAGTDVGPLASELRGQARFTLARVLAKTDPARAHTLAVAARDDLKVVMADQLPAIDVWLAAHPSHPP